MFEKKYFLSSLYLGKICGIYMKDSKTLSLKKDETRISILQFIPEKGYGYGYNIKDKSYYDIINRCDYRHIGDCDFYELKRNILNSYVYATCPLRSVLEKGDRKRKIKESKIFELFDCIKEENNNSVSNPFFIEVIKVREKITNNMSPELVQYYNDKLMEISKIYMQALIENYEKIKLNPNYEFEILSECLTSLASLEIEINKSNELSDFSSDLLNNFDTLTEKIKNI